MTRKPKTKTSKPKKAPKKARKSKKKEVKIKVEPAQVKSVDESLRKIENSFENSFDKLDGISYFADNYLFNVRGSNTEPKLRLNAEAKDSEILDKIISKIKNIIGE